MALIFDNFFDSTVTSSANSAAFQAAVNAVENFLTSQLTTFGANSDVTLRINWRFATTDYKGNAFGPNTLANNVFLDTDTFSYTDIRNALLARVDSNDANPGDDAAFTGALPATDPGVATAGNTVLWTLSRDRKSCSVSVVLRQMRAMPKQILIPVSRSTVPSLSILIAPMA